VTLITPVLSIQSYLGSSSSNGVVKARIPKLETYLSSVAVVYGSKDINRNKIFADVVRTALLFLDPENKRRQLLSVGADRASLAQPSRQVTASPVRSQDQAVSVGSSASSSSSEGTGTDPATAISPSASSGSTESTIAATPPTPDTSREPKSLTDSFTSFCSNVSILSFTIAVWLSICTYLDPLRALQFVLLFMVIHIIAFGVFWFGLI
jgi:hypothetical protein